jgi:AraC-like DNA-binding protein/tetratricopeptide (TPR) repeat protein
MKEPPITDQVVISKLTDIIHKNLGNENFGVVEFARQSGLSRSGLSRKLKKIANKTISQFIREVRLQKALEMLKNEELSAYEVAYKVGFSSPAYFNTCFHEFFGYPPGKVRIKSLESPEEETLTHAPGQQNLHKHNWEALIYNKSWIMVLFVLTGIAAFLLYPKIVKGKFLDDLRSSDGKISIAVMPFQNMTNDTTWNIWQYGIQQSLISSLSNTGELKVRQKESINIMLQAKGLTESATISPSIAGTISRKLDADIFICGNIQKAGSKIRIDATFFNTKTNEVLKSIEITQPYRQEIIFDLTDSLKKRVTDFLQISKLIKEYPIYQVAPHTTRSPEALRYCIYGDKANNDFDDSTARTWYLKALAIDSNYFEAYVGLFSTGTMEQNIQGILKLYKKRDQMPTSQQLYTNCMYAQNFESPDEHIKWLKQYEQYDDQTPLTFYLLGYEYDKLQQYDKAIPEFKKFIELCQKFGLKYFLGFAALGETYHKMGQFKAEKKVYKEAERKIPDHSHGSFSWIIRNQAIISLTEKDTVTANRYIAKYISYMKDNSVSETEIEKRLAFLYDNANLPDNAEKYYRKALSFEPENPGFLNEFAWFLARNNRKPTEFTTTIDKALKLATTKWDYYNYLDTKGYGLYKLGKNEEALEVLQRTWDSATFKMYFIKSHLEEVRRAVGLNR